MSECLICQSAIKPFVSFGKMPIANGFLKAGEFPNEYFFDLQVAFCENCGMVQLLEQPDREMMFHENYAYFSSISTRMAEHFKSFANMVRDTYLAEDPFIIELGSNDGIMLHHFADAGIRHLGVEPSANVAEAARKRGVDTVCEFFDEALAERIKTENGPAHAILAANVMCHIPYLHSVVAGMAKLLAPRGVVIFEDPYLGDIIEKISYDQIYDEHVFYFSVASVEYLFAQHGLEIIDIEPQNVHGGSMRYIIARKDAYQVSEVVLAQKTRERELGLNDMGTYHNFRRNVEASRDTLMTALRDLKSRGRRVIGYGATSKSTTVTNYCGITPELVEFISDTTPNKQGKFSPGTHIPIKPYEDFSNNPPDVALLFAWNHGEEIMAKEKGFRDNGGQWLVYVPSVELIS